MGHWGLLGGLLSTDMPHAELRENAVTELRDRADIADRVKRKICFDNPKAFYGI